MILGLILITVINEVIGQQGAARRRRPIAYDSGKPMRPGGVNPSTIDSIFQIPIAAIQGTSAVAQSFYPDNGDTIDKVFDIPVQTLHAVGNLIKDRYSQQTEKNSDRNSKRDETQELEIRRRQLEEKKRTRELERLKRQQPFSVQQGDQAEGRKHHSIYDPLAWTDAFADLLVGHGGLFSGHGGFFGGHGHNHGSIFGGHKKKKKKKKPHAGYFQQLGGHNHGHGDHFGGHGHGQDAHGHGQGGHGSHGVPQNSDHDNLYEVTENLDDVQPEQGFFSWFYPPRQSPPIQNKIAPGFNNRSYSR